MVPTGHPRATLHRAMCKAAMMRSAGTEPTVPPTAEKSMLHYAVIFFVIALIAAVFGFAGIAAGAAGIAKILFFVFLILAIVSFIANTARR
jgi:uncharacterized membrane protein YtjA (UPF0391 family)